MEIKFHEELTISIQSRNVISELSIMLFSIMILVHITSQYKTKFSMDGCLFWEAEEWRRRENTKQGRKNISV